MTKRLTSIPLNLADFKKYTQTFRTKLEQIEYLAENKLVVQNELEQNKNIGGNNNALMLEMVDYAENEIKKLGGKPEKWIEYPLVTNVHDFNVRKESMKDEGRLLEWVKWLLNNVEPPVEENEGIKKDLGWSYNDRVLRQAKLDCIEQGKEYVELKWDASNLDDDFVDHLERQLKTNTDLLPSPPENKHASVAWIPNTPEYNFIENFEKETTSGKRKPHTFYIATEKIDGIKRGVSWNKLKRLASESKGAKQIELNGFGKIYLKRDRENPETVLRYKHTEFEQPDDGDQITKGAFDMAWTSEKQSKKKGNI